MAGWNPKWLTFLATKRMTPEDADKLERPARISLNAEFICWNMSNAPMPTYDSKKGLVWK